VGAGNHIRGSRPFKEVLERRHLVEGGGGCSASNTGKREKTDPSVKSTTGKEKAFLLLQLVSRVASQAGRILPA